MAEYVWIDGHNGLRSKTKVSQAFYNYLVDPLSSLDGKSLPVSHQHTAGTAGGPLATTKDWTRRSAPRKRANTVFPGALTDKVPGGSAKCTRHRQLFVSDVDVGFSRRQQPHFKTQKMDRRFLRGYMLRSRTPGRAELDSLLGTCQDRTCTMTQLRNPPCPADRHRKKPHPTQKCLAHVQAMAIPRFLRDSGSRTRERGILLNTAILDLRKDSG